MSDQPLPLYGDGLHVRDWVHVEDHGRAILTVLEKGEVGHSYNVSADNERSNIDLAKMMLRLLGKDESSITFVAERPGHDRRYAIEPSKALAALGWTPKYDAAHFEQGLRETVEWFQAHQDWADRAIVRAKGVNAHITT
jgi:dTDP-glucose 4,6-dehydratase